MVEVGILGEAEHLELIDGELIVRPPQGPEHASLAAQLDAMLRAAYPEGKHVRAALPLDLGEATNPEPDLAVILGAAQDFRTRHPRGDDAVLVVEVTQTTHKLDHAKASRYAQAGVPVYWIVDVPARCVEVYSDAEASEGRYVTRRILGAGQVVTPPGTDVTWAVAVLFAGL